MFPVYRLLLVIGFAVPSLASFAHPPDPPPKPYSWIPRHLIVKDTIHSATAFIEDVTLTGGYVTELTGGGVTDLHHHPEVLSPTDVVSATDIAHLTDDRGPGWWLPGSDVFCASLAYKTRSLDQIAVQGYRWPLVSEDPHISYEYSDADSTVIVGFTLRRESERTAQSTRPNRVEWTYLSTEYAPGTERPAGLALLAGEPAEACLNGVAQFGGF